MGLGKLRNLPCLCGSGKKRKNCCTEMKVHLSDYLRDPISRNFINFYRNNQALVESFRKEKWRYYREKVSLMLPVGRHEGLSVESLLNSIIINLVPDAIKNHLALQSKYFWIALDRRISPHGVLEENFHTPESVRLAKTYMNNVIRFYAKSEFTSSFAMAQDVKYSDQDYMVIYELEIIGCILQELAVNKRICAKGGILSVTSSGVELNYPSGLRKALNKFDQDLSKRDSLAGYFGLNDTLSLADKTTEEILKVRPIINIRPFSAKELEGRKSDFFSPGNPPHCMPGFTMPEDLYQFNESFNHEFKRLIGIDYMTWLRCLATVSNYLPAGSEVDMQQKLFKLGYSITDIANVTASISEEKDTTEVDASIFLNHAIMKEVEPATVNKLLDLYTPYFIYQFADKKILIDGYLIGGYIIKTITEVLSAVAHRTDFGRGRQFELQTVLAGEKIRLLRPYPPNFEFKKNSKTVAEVDDCIEISGLLLLLDCKSIISDLDVNNGDFAVTQKRVSYIRDLLQAKDQKMKALSKARSGDNYTLSNSMVAVHIISAEVEWLPPDDPDFWWADGIPRVSTIAKFRTEVLPFLKTYSRGSEQYVFDVID